MKTFIQRMNYLALKGEVSDFSSKNLSLDRKLSILRGFIPRNLCIGKKFALKGGVLHPRFPIKKSTLGMPAGVLALLLAFIFTACPTGVDPQNNDPTVTRVTVNSQSTWVKKGGTLNFIAAVAGTNNPATTIMWSIDEGGEAGTVINTTGNNIGILTVAADETLPTLTIRATSMIDSAKSGAATVSVVDENAGAVITTVTITGTEKTEGGALVKAKVGDTLLATAKDASGKIVTDAEFQWKRANGEYEQPSDIEDAAGAAYTLIQADLGKFIRVAAKNSATTTEVVSGSTEEVLPGATGGSGSGKLITFKGGEPTGSEGGGYLYWIDPKVTNPSDYTLITGFTLKYTVVTPGHLGGEDANFPVSVIMAAKGETTPGDYEVEYFPGTLPTYRGTAEEIATHATGPGAYVGPMVFFNCINDGGDTGTYKEVGIGSQITWTYTGTTPLFDSAVSMMTVYGMWGTFEVTSITWIKGDMVAGAPTENWSPVAVRNYPDIETALGGGNGYNYIDITVPAQGSGPFPVIFWIHGGGWTTLNRKSVIISDTKDYMLYKGYAWVSADYALAKSLEPVDTTAWPQMVYDLKHALRWLRAHGAEYNLDTSYIVSMGESAGGHLALMLGTTNGNPAYENKTTGYETYSSTVQAMVSYYGGITMASQFFKGAPTSNPVNLITAACPPVFLTHGENDNTAPIQNSYSFENKYKSVKGGDDITTLYHVSAPHGSRAVFDSSQTMARVKNFIIGHNPSAEYGIDDSRIVSQWRHNSNDNVSITFSVDGTFFMSGNNQGAYTLANKRLAMNITTLNLTIIGNAEFTGDDTLTISQINNTNFTFLNGAYTAVQGVEGGIKIDDDRIFGTWANSAYPELGELTFTADGYCTSSLSAFAGYAYAYTLQETVMKTNLYAQTDEGKATFTNDDTLVFAGFTATFGYFNGDWTRVSP